MDLGILVSQFQNSITTMEILTLSQDLEKGILPSLFLVVCVGRGGGTAAFSVELGSELQSGGPHRRVMVNPDLIRLNAESLTTGDFGDPFSLVGE